MSSEATSSGTCQVDFYLLGESSSGADRVACHLALMAWERKHRIFVIVDTESSAKQLDQLMWQHPEARFLPHAQTAEPDSARAPVKIGIISSLYPTDVVINLCPEAVPQPERFSRILEIVPFTENEKKASRVKYKAYRNLGLKPQTHEISK